MVDLAKGHLSALEYANDHTGAEAFNLGTGNGISVLEIVNAFMKENHIDVPYVIGPRRDGDLPGIWANADKAREVLDWTAKLDVNDMCRDAWTFIQTPKD